MNPAKTFRERLAMERQGKSRDPVLHEEPPLGILLLL
jgi:hypothetical protein